MIVPPTNTPPADWSVIDNCMEVCWIRFLVAAPTPCAQLTGLLDHLKEEAMMYLEGLWRATGLERVLQFYSCLIALKRAISLDMVMLPLGCLYLGLSSSHGFPTLSSCLQYGWVAIRLSWGLVNSFWCPSASFSSTMAFGPVSWRWSLWSLCWLDRAFCICWKV